jgi:hypothetical protein
MASILDRYGIKEVADVTFYNIDKATGEAGAPVLYLDTLKVSTIEQTAETTDARGGKGNPKLVTWDYGKDITVTLEDALFSAKSLSVMFGNGTVNPTAGVVFRTVMAKVTSDRKAPEYFVADVYTKKADGTAGAERKKVYFGTAKADGIAYADSGLKVTKITSEAGNAGAFANGKILLPTDSEANDRIFITYEVAVNKKEIVISADTFPGTYYVTGDTYARSDVDGSDQFFQFIIPKAKVTSENTITLEAEGDPSVFNMNLSVLRPEDGEMMKLVQYDLTDAADETDANKEGLTSLIITIQNYLDEGKEIEDTASYTAALNVFQKVDATQEEIDEAVENLYAIIEAIENEENPT